MSRRIRAGFSLVELMVVVSVVAITLATGTPAVMKSIPGMRVSGAARELLSDMRLARTRSVEKGKNVVFKFHVDGAGNGEIGTYILAFDDNNDGDYTGGTDELIKEVRLGEEYVGIEFDTNDSTASATDGVNLGGGALVAFRTNGAATQSGSAYLMPGQDSPARDDRNRRVRLVGPTGNLRIENYDGNTWQ